MLHALEPARRTTRSHRWLGPSIDDTAIYGRKTRWHRLCAGAIAAALIAANLGAGIGALWFGVCCASELLSWLASRQLREGRSGSNAERGTYLVALTMSTLNWSFAALLYWFNGSHGFQIVSIVVASAMLIHAQAFTFRSRAVFFINGTPPAAVLVAVVFVFGKLSGLELLTAGVGVATTLGYVVASAHANRAAARALDLSRDELEKIAYSDALTTLANRRRFTEDMRRLMAYSQRHGTRFALVLIDLDRFKTINDQLGHAAGDALLVAAADRLRALTIGDDCVARLGGDEFAVLIADAGESRHVGAFCQEILDSFAADIDFDGSTLATTPSIGVAIYPNDAKEHEALYKAADTALYAAKNSGRNTWRAFDGGRVAAV